MGDEGPRDPSLRSGQAVPGPFIPHPPSPIPSQDAPSTYLIIIAGIGGSPEHATAFYEWGKSIADAATEKFGVPKGNVTYLAESPERDRARIGGKSTKEGVEQAIAAVAARARPGDQLWLVLIGHGSSQPDGARFNLPGPDLTDADFKRLLAPLAQQRVAVVNAASASGDWAKTLAAPNRAIVTATKSGFERNETMFAKYFAAAFAAEGTAGADADKDGGISLLEAFDYARREVARVYESDNRLQTEHAQIADSALARTLVLSRAASSAVAAAAAAAAAGDPALAALLREKQGIESRLAQHRARKASLDSAAYEMGLEKLLVELARKNQEIRAKQGGKP
ncbi:MAG TPA: hypothetical protein VKA84_28430 [Gemmatimonadaceae bacterium]|nr:hypothetical protein [Gemmatimonadaceae bacterium]